MNWFCLMAWTAIPSSAAVAGSELAFLVFLVGLPVLLLFCARRPNTLSILIVAIVPPVLLTPNPLWRRFVFLKSLKPLFSTVYGATFIEESRNLLVQL